MKPTRRVAALFAAAAIAVSSLIAAPNVASAAEVDVYTTPGGHSANGRLWQTSCAMYSSTVVRCQTNIFATIVRRQGNAYVRDTGFHFNNLTYLPSSRAQWANNPLGKTGNFTSQGRQWRTECDTAATGKGGCRSYIKTAYVAVVNGAYVTKNDFIFNNMVRFAEGSIKPVTSIPPDVLSQSRLDFTGFGPIRLGMPAVDAGRLGYLEFLEDDVCFPMWAPTEDLFKRGLDVYPIEEGGVIWGISLLNNSQATSEGAKVGMTIGQIKSIYGSNFKVVSKLNYGVAQYFGSLRKGDTEILFRVDGGQTLAPTRPLVDSDVVAEIRLGQFTSDVTMDGC